MARFYTNENLPRHVIEELRRLGHDVLTSYEAGNANTAIADSEVLAFAIESRRILVTYNRRHFVRLHQQRTSDHAGIVVCTFDPEFIRQARSIDAAITAEGDMKNKLLRVNRPS